MANVSLAMLPVQLVVTLQIIACLHVLQANYGISINVWMFVHMEVILSVCMTVFFQFVILAKCASVDLAMKTVLNVKDLIIMIALNVKVVCC